MSDLIAISAIQERWVDLNPRAFPPNERAEVERLRRFVYNVSHYHARFVRAISLYHRSSKSFAPKKGKPDIPHMLMMAEWMQIATRDGAIAASHFGNSLFKVNNSAKKIQTIAGKSNKKILPNAVIHFKEHFSQVFDIRDLIAHEWDHNQGRNRYTGTVIAGITGQNNLVNTFDEGRIVGTINGRAAVFSFSPEGLRQLSKCRDMMIEALEPLGRPFVSTHTREIFSPGAKEQPVSPSQTVRPQS